MKPTSSKKIQLIASLCFFMLLLISASMTGLAAQENGSGPDAYEDDDSFSQANVIDIGISEVPGSVEPQLHNFHNKGDEDWVKFYGIAKDPAMPYQIEVKNAGANCDAVIELYDSDGTTLIDSRNDYYEGADETLDFACIKEGIYYVKVKNYDPEIFGENTGYELSISCPQGSVTGIGIISGMIYYRSGFRRIPIDSAFIKTSANVSTISVEGVFLMIHPDGTYIITVIAEGYQNYPTSVTVNAGESVTVDIAMIPAGSTTTTTIPCPAEAIYGEHSEETELLRVLRDKVLNGTPEGREMIRLYYEWSPEMVKTIEENKELEDKLKNIIDGILLVINSRLKGE